jgi:DNA-binding transcriptional LysR family regulator
MNQWPPIDLKRLRCFVAVADNLHFGRAADELAMAQPPLSQQIQRLERQLGTKLFDRSTRQVRLTEVGALLLPEARGLLVAADGLERLAHEYLNGDRGLLRVGFVDSSAFEVVPRLMTLFREQWPQVEFELQSMSSDEQAAAHDNGAIDLGVCRTIGARTDLRTVQLQQERLLVAMHQAQAANFGRLRFADLKGCRFVGFDRGVSPTLHSELAMRLARHGVQYDPRIEATEYSTILGLVASGEGAAIVPESVMSLKPPGLRYVRLDNADAVVPLILTARENNTRPLVRTGLRVGERLARLLVDLSSIHPDPRSAGNPSKT